MYLRITKVQNPRYLQLNTYNFVNKQLIYEKIEINLFTKIVIIYS